MTAAAQGSVLKLEWSVSLPKGVFLTTFVLGHVLTAQWGSSQQVSEFRLLSQQKTITATKTERLSTRSAKWIQALYSFVLLDPTLVKGKVRGWDSCSLFSCSLWAQWKGHTPLLPRYLCLGLGVVNSLGCPSAPMWLMPVGVWIWGLQALQLAGHNWVRRDMRTAVFSEGQCFVCDFVFLCIWISLIFLNIQRA